MLSVELDDGRERAQESRKIQLPIVCRISGNVLSHSGVDHLKQRPNPVESVQPHGDRVERDVSHREVGQRENSAHASVCWF